MKPDELLTELERLSTILDDPNADNTAGRVEAIQYDVLPQLLSRNRETIVKALRRYCQTDVQLELHTL